jgi:Ca-activated chloride channel family protein
MVLLAARFGIVIQYPNSLTHARTDVNVQETVHNFHFIRPLWLLVLPLAWSIVYWLMRKPNQQGNWTTLIDAELLPSLILDKGNENIRPTSALPWLLFAWTFAACAMAGPTWKKDATTAYSAPASWVVLYNLSPSMMATDVSPSRYMRARYAIDDILAGAHDAHVALVAFSEEAFTVTPLTADVSTIRSLLPSLSPDMMPSAGNNLAPALEQANKLLAQDGSKNQHVIVLLDHFGDPAAALRAASRLKTHGAHVDVIGIGTVGGAPLKDEQGNFVKDDAGHPKISTLNTNQLQQLAEAGGGQYVDLAQLSTLIKQLQTTPNPDRHAVAEQKIIIEHWQDEGIWLLPLVLIFAALFARRGIR